MGCCNGHLIFMGFNSQMIAHRHLLRFYAIDAFCGDRQTAILLALDPSFFAEVPEVKLQNFSRQIHHFLDRHHTDRWIIFILTAASIKQTEQFMGEKQGRAGSQTL